MRQKRAAPDCRAMTHGGAGQCARNETTSEDKDSGFILMDPQDDERHSSVVEDIQGTQVKGASCSGAYVYRLS